MAVAMGAVFQAETWGNKSGGQKRVQLHNAKSAESLHELCGQFANHHARCTQELVQC